MARRVACIADVQEHKAPFLDTVGARGAMAGDLPPVLRSLAFDTRRMREAAAAGFSTATDLADYLVRKGLPFRQAHEIVGRIVRHALDAGKGLEEFALDDLRRFSALFEKDAFDAVSLEASLRAHAVTGGTAPAAVRQALV